MFATQLKKLLKDKAKGPQAALTAMTSDKLASYLPP